MSNVVNSKTKFNDKLKKLVERAKKFDPRSLDKKGGEVGGSDRNRNRKPSEFEIVRSGSSNGYDKWERIRKREFGLSAKRYDSDEGVGGSEMGRFRSVNLSQKRKRSYADRSFEERKAIYNDLVGERSEKRASERTGVVRDRKSIEDGLMTKKRRHVRGRIVVEGSEKLRVKAKTADKSNEKGRLKMEERTATKKSGVSSEGGLFEASKKVNRKKKVSSEKASVDALEGTKDKPKRKKRVIRIDPYDISNKRLDDGVSIKEVAEKDEEKSNELSKNAQFRAIKPSPSILSFVEDNLLGRRRMIEWRRAGYNIELSAPLDNVPFSTSSEREKVEESVFRNKLTFFAAAKVSSSFPPPDLPEIAFAGRSNVGKSSLLNAITRQWGVVRTSDKPGLTQTINFFNLGLKLCCVDLPGYGFAYAKEEVKDAWEELVKEYVSTRANLRRVCLLIDTKWGMKPRDHELIDLMERSQTKYQIVLTKTDVVFPIDVARRAMQIEESLKTNRSAVKPVMMVSSKTGAGIRAVRSVLANVIRFAK